MSGVGPAASAFWDDHLPSSALTAAPADDGGVHLSLARSVSWPEAGGRPSMGMRRAGGLITRVLCIEADGVPTLLFASRYA
jgi:hypothetical protein